MRTILLLLSSFLFIPLGAYSQISTSFDLNDSTGTISPISLCGGDNNSIYTIGQNTLNYRQVITKLDANNQVIWSRQLELDSSSYILSMSDIEYHDNAVYVLATINVIPVTYLLVKLDANGNTIFKKTLRSHGLSSYGYPSLKLDEAYGIFVSSSTWEGIDIYSLAFDGTANWVRSCTNDSILLDSMAYKNPCFDLSVDGNGNIMGCSKTESDMSIFKIANDGQPLWSKRVYENNVAYTRIKNIIHLPNDTYFICGYRFNDLMLGYQNGFYAYLDNTGNFIDFEIVDQLTDIKYACLDANGDILLDAEAAFYYRVFVRLSGLGNIIEANQFNEPPSNFVGPKNTMLEQNGYKYFAGFDAIEKLIDFSGLSCLGINPITLTKTSLDVTTIPISSFLLVTSSGTITNSTTSIISNATVTSQVNCESFVGLDESNAEDIRIFPTALSNDESIFITHSLESTTIDYQILDLNGKVVALNTLKDNSIPINVLSAGMYVIQFAVKGNVIHSDKFVVVN